MSGLELHVDFDDDGIAAAFEKAPAEFAESLVDGVEEVATKLQSDWRAGARRSSGRHGKHYPKSITHDLTHEEGALTADIGPDRGLLQGRMGPGFEYGSVHQPPHMDGASAFARNAQGLDRAVKDALDTALRAVE